MFMNLRKRIQPTVFRSGSRAVLAIVLLLAACASDGKAQQPWKPTNLKVIDSTITRDSLISIMRNFSMALGVGCDHCHAKAVGKSQGELDFPSDSNKVKLTARDMLRMVGKIDGTYLVNLPTPDTPLVSVQCVTCHHGQTRPELLQDVLRRQLLAHGFAACDSTYRELRRRYYGSFSYDFTDYPLADLAFEVAPTNDSAAFQILRLNREFNPNSALTEWTAGRIYAERGDTAVAIAQFQRALEIDPNYRRAQHDLQQLTHPRSPR
jgi:hypothetical protein